MMIKALTPSKPKNDEVFMFYSFLIGSDTVERTECTHCREFSKGKLVDLFNPLNNQGAAV